MKVLRREDYDSLESLKAALGWDFWLDEGPVDEVRLIIARVREEGDAALAAFTRDFDGVDITPDRLRVSEKDLAAARQQGHAGLRGRGKGGGEVHHRFPPPSGLGIPVLGN